MMMPRTLHAAGFAQPEQGAMSAGLAGAVTARTDVPEAGFFNPASYAMTPGFLASIHLGILNPTLTWTPPDGGVATSTEPNTALIPNMHLTHNFGFLTLNLSLQVPYGSSVTWPKGWEGRYQVESSSLQMLEVATNIAMRPLERLALSIGVRLMPSSFRLSQKLDVLRKDQDASVMLSGLGMGIGLSTSVFYRASNQLDLGFSFRSGVDVEMSGEADFKDVPVELEGKAHDTEFETVFATPWRLAIGAAWHLEDMTISGDLEWWGWSSFDVLHIDFKDANVADRTQQRGWSNTLALRLGYEHALWDNTMRLRTGFFFEPSPASTKTLTPSAPDSDRLGLNFGLGYSIYEGLKINWSLGYTFMLGLDVIAQDAYPGAYGGSILSTSFGLAYTPGT